MRRGPAPGVGRLALTGSRAGSIIGAAFGYVGYSGAPRDGPGTAMARIPSVANGLLDVGAPGGAAALAVGSPAWFAWLADDAARSFSVRSADGGSTPPQEHPRGGGGHWGGPPPGRGP